MIERVEWTLQLERFMVNFQAAGILAFFFFASPDPASGRSPDQEPRAQQKGKVVRLWFLRNQKADGHWVSPKGKHDWGVTALATLRIGPARYVFDDSPE